MTIETDFLNCATEKLIQLCSRIETCLGKLTPEQIWMRGAENQNAVGNLVLHLNGNVRQWILSGVGGEPDARIRDEEFAARGGIEREVLGRQLRETVDGAVAVIRSLPHSRLADHTTIQGYDVTVLKAIFHVVEHFSGHTAQIIFVTKMLTGEDLGFYSYLSKPRSQAGTNP
ncbi:MAG: hypothetical protein JWO19_5119 [Bryobacterales bacterium]|nr:hypothetical protein [Bryobacterales bacterium]